jgi:hypothetical protein
MEAYYGTIKAQGWKAKSEALTAGVIAGKAAFTAETGDRMFYNDYRTLDNCLSAFLSHINYYHDDELFLEVVDVEEPFKIELAPGLYFTGKIDMKVKLNSALWYFEHKTTGQSIDKQMKSLQRDPQIIGYTYAGFELSEDHVEGIMIPMLSVSSTKSRVTGEYGKVRIDHRRSPQIFTDGDFASWKESFIWTAEQIENSIYHNFWPMQYDSCYHFGSCAYCSLCEQNAPLAEINTDNFIAVRPWNVLTEGKEVSE